MPTFDFTTLGLPFLMRKVASRPSTSIGLSSSAIASWRISPSIVGTSRPPSTANPSARATVLAGISAVTVPALTVTGADCASETRASASAVASSLMLGSTVTTTASTGARGSRKASVMAAAVASRSSARPSVPGVMTPSPFSTSTLGSTAGRSMFWAMRSIWAESSGSSTAATAGSAVEPNMPAMRATGFQVWPNAGATDASASSDRPASSGRSPTVSSSARTRSRFSAMGARPASTAAAASDWDMPEMSIPWTVVPGRAVLPEDIARRR